MTKTITAQIPARNGYPARIATYTQDEAGVWFNQHDEKVFEEDVIDVCQMASNWADIKQAHFPMAGFHAAEKFRADPSHKSDE